MTLWLTRVSPSLDHPNATRDFSDVNRLHQRIMELFPSDLGPNPRTAAGVLFRVETRHNGLAVLLQSTLKPTTTRWPPGYGQLQTIDLTPRLTTLHNGSTVRYRLLGNPSKQLPRGHTGPGKPGQRVPLHGDAAEQWWRARAHTAGLTLHSAIMLPQNDLKGHTKKVHHAAALYEGTATIHDPTTLRATIHNGIGRGKSHGCGLLSIAPLPNQNAQDGE